jgi:hypothetical protein
VPAKLLPQLANLRKTPDEVIAEVGRIRATRRARTLPSCWPTWVSLPASTSPLCSRCVPS